MVMIGKNVKPGVIRRRHRQRHQRRLRRRRHRFGDRRAGDGRRHPRGQEPRRGGAHAGRGARHSPTPWSPATTSPRPAARSSQPRSPPHPPSRQASPLSRFSWRGCRKRDRICKLESALQSGRATSAANDVSSAHQSPGAIPDGTAARHPAAAVADGPELFQLPGPSGRLRHDRQDRRDVQPDASSSSGSLAFVNLMVFALASSISGPIADRIGPRKVIFTGVVVWSVATIGSAMSHSFLMLLFCRAVVGVGEGAYGPSANTLLCAAAPPEKRGRALGIYNIGMAFGGTSGLVLGNGAGARGWTGTRCSGSLAGRRSCWPACAAFVAAPARLPRPAALPARAYLLAPTYLLALAGGILATFGASALIIWSPWLIIEERGFSVNVGSVFMAAVGIVCGVGGVVAGGYLGDALNRRAPRRPRARHRPFAAGGGAVRRRDAADHAQAGVHGADGHHRLPAVGLQRPVGRHDRRAGPAAVRGDAAGVHDVLDPRARQRACRARGWLARRPLIRRVGAAGCGRSPSRRRGCCS